MLDSAVQRLNTSDVAVTCSQLEISMTSVLAQLHTSYYISHFRLLCDTAHALLGFAVWPDHADNI